ncbi:MAG: 3-ketoacyl-CoA thiolase [Pseudolabrys sp.]|nr:3-ketoacyl-CoA thiolase [Pseudolabrys sp.]
MRARNDVCIAGAGMTKFGKHMDRTLAGLAREAVDNALASAGIEDDDVDLVLVSNSMAGLLQGQESIRGQVIFADGRFAGVPIVNIENACAGGATAVQVANWALSSGSARTVIALGAEKLFHQDKAATFRALASASDVTEPSPPERSIFMDFYASRARDHMAAFGTTIEMIAEVAAKNRRHGALNPLAQFREAVSRDDVLASRPVAAPLTLLMCSPISDGAAALVLRKQSDVPAGASAVAVRAQALRSGSITGPEFLTIGAAAREALGKAGMTVKNLDVAEVHDATAIAEIEAIEAIGIAARGDGGPFALAGETALGGAIPVNTSGGLSSRGHPVGATGIAQLCELTWQLTGKADARQVADATVAIAENHGGLIGNDVAVAAITILERVS